MTTISLDQSLIENLIRISKNAGEAIMGIYESDFSINIKTDQSPLTKADLLSNKIICQSLKEITPDIPILSEESSDITYQERAEWKQYWLVDPLDGTKEFIKKNGEFTTNIALIRNNRPIFGIIHAPAINETYWGSENSGSFAIYGSNAPHKIGVRDFINEPLEVMVSRSHKSDTETAFFERIGNYTPILMGSSLKLCYLASGKADIYPRFGQTSEWDIAAGDAILTFAGGNICGSSKKNILYNSKSNYLNDSFLASSNDRIKNKVIDAFRESIY